MEPATLESEETPGLKIPKNSKLFVNFHLSHVNDAAGQSELLLAMQDSLDIDYSVTTYPEDANRSKCVSIQVPTKFNTSRGDYKVLAAQEAHDILDRLIADYFQVRGKSDLRREEMLKKFRQFL
jgi:hypothetical protein